MNAVYAAALESLQEPVIAPGMSLIMQGSAVEIFFKRHPKKPSKMTHLNG